jgi:hypothetical protein
MLNGSHAIGWGKSLLWAIMVALVLCLARPAAAEPEPLGDSVYLVALTVLYEATGQPELGQRLVAHVVVNRAGRIGTPWYETVVFADAQFLGWTNVRRLQFARCQIEQSSNPACFDAMAFNYLGNAPGAGERWLDLLAMALAVSNGAPEPEGFEGVVNFDNPRFWDGGEPPWAWAKEYLGKVGDHQFWR